MTRPFCIGSWSDSWLTAGPSYSDPPKLPTCKARTWLLSVAFKEYFDGAKFIDVS